MILYVHLASQCARNLVLYLYYVLHTLQYKELEVKE